MPKGPREFNVRKPLIASATACLIAFGLTGCGDESNDAQVSRDLEALIDDMGMIDQGAAAPLKDNKLLYTNGTTIDGVQVPGALTQTDAPTELTLAYVNEAARLDQAIALLPQAQAIAKNGNARQKATANNIIASILLEEAGYLIDLAESGYQQSAYDITGLHSRATMLQDIVALNQNLAGGRDVIINVIRTGEVNPTTKVDGIEPLKQQAQTIQKAADAAKAELAEIKGQIAAMRDRAQEYEGLELKFSNEALGAQGSAHYDKLEQATVASYEANLAEAQAESLLVSAQVTENAADLTTAHLQRLEGDRAGTSDASMMAAFERMLGEEAQKLAITRTSDAYQAIDAIVKAIRDSGNNDDEQAAALLLELAVFGSSGSDKSNQLVGATHRRINSYLGVVGALELKISQIKLEQRQTQAQLNELNASKDALIKQTTEAFNQYDAEMRVLGFDRMAKAKTQLDKATSSLTMADLGLHTDQQLLGAYLLQARVLHQQATSAESYQSILAALSTAGPEVLGKGLYDSMTRRTQQMMDLQKQVKADVAKLKEQARDTLSVTSLDEDANTRKQVQIYRSLLNEIDQATGSGGETEILGGGDVIDDVSEITIDE